MIINYKVLLSRVIELLISPRKTFEVIASEPDPGKELILRYVLLLALIPSVAGFLGNLLYGQGFFHSFFYSLLQVGVFVGSVFILGILISTMAPSFGASRNENLSFRLAAYVSTPVWILGFLILVPDLTLLAALLGFGYAIYLFYIGSQVLLEIPAEEAAKFALISIISWFAIVLVTTIVTSRISALLFAQDIVLNNISPANTKYFIK
jgi:hypothetical protein